MVLYGGGAKQVRTLSELGWFLTTGTLAQLFALVVVVVKLFMSPLQGKAAHPLADSPPCCLDGLTCSCRMLCSGRSMTAASLCHMLNPSLCGILCCPVECMH